ncbi:MAG: sulfate adenylyltransferase [Chloroflexi bacterium]|nr:sulfate adenylyltransferase [Chloroflexota bacterium]
MTGILPHGGTLVNRVLRGEVGKAVAERAQSLPRIALDSTRMSDLELIATGALSPLTGFMGQVDYEKVVREMRLASNLVWTIPVVLPVSRELAATLAEGQEVALCEGDRVLAVMEVREKFEYDKQLEAQEVYRTTEEQHPGVARLYGQGEVLLGGDIWLVDWPSAATTEFPDFRFAPADTRRAFAGRGWKRIVGFQTRNPIHRAHEYIQKVAMELVDGLMLHPLVGETKGDDIPADVRMMSYQTLLSSYYPADRVMLGVFPAAMRYAGPREAVFHAIARKNYGVTHFIVGRDHAGVGNYYGTYDAQRIFDNFRPEEIGLTLLFFDHTFYCRKCGGIVSIKTCPHDRSEHVVLSGTQVRQLLERGEALPTEFTRPEVSKVLVDGMQARLKAKA